MRFLIIAATLFIGISSSFAEEPDKLSDAEDAKNGERAALMIRCARRALIAEALTFLDAYVTAHETIRLMKILPEQDRRELFDLQNEALRELINATPAYLYLDFRILNEQLKHGYGEYDFALVEKELYTMVVRLRAHHDQVIKPEGSLNKMYPNVYAIELTDKVCQNIPEGK